MLKRKILDIVEKNNIECAGNDPDEQCLAYILVSMASSGNIINFKDVVFDSDFVSIMKDDDLHSSISAFFSNNLNISETSKQSFLHRNTLVYRLEKIEKMTGFNLKNFSDAVSFRLLMEIYSRLSAK